VLHVGVSVYQRLELAVLASQHIDSNVNWTQDKRLSRLDLEAADDARKCASGVQGQDRPLYMHRLQATTWNENTTKLVGLFVDQ